MNVENRGESPLPLKSGAGSYTGMMIDVLRGYEWDGLVNSYLTLNYSWMLYV